MGSVVGLLARIGGDASLRYMSAETLAALLREEGLAPDFAERFRAASPAVWFATQLPVSPEREDDDPLDDDHGDGDDDNGPYEPLKPVPHPGEPRPRP